MVCPHNLWRPYYEPLVWFMIMEPYYSYWLYYVHVDAKIFALLETNP